MAWRMVMRRCPMRSMTLVGDLAQTSDPAGAIVLGAGAAAVRAAGLPGRGADGQLPHSGRDHDGRRAGAGRHRPCAVGAELGPRCRHRTVPPSRWPRCRPAGAGGDVVGRRDRQPRHARGDRFRSRRGGRRAEAAVLHSQAGWRSARAPTAVEQPVLFEMDDGPTELRRHVVVLTVPEVKGLEFDSVIVADPGGIIAESERGLSDLYVALTRSTQRLAVVHTGELPVVLRRLREPPPEPGCRRPLLPASAPPGSVRGCAASPDRSAAARCRRPPDPPTRRRRREPWTWPGSASPSRTPPPPSRTRPRGCPARSPDQ